MPINYKEYPPDWKQIRERILLRAENKCEFCGAPNGTYYTKINGKYFLLSDPLPTFFTGNQDTKKIVLTIAHLDHDHKNHLVKDERLAALCQACHLSYDRPRHIFKRKYGMEVFNQPTLF